MTAVRRLGLAPLVLMLMMAGCGKLTHPAGAQTGSSPPPSAFANVPTGITTIPPPASESTFLDSNEFQDWNDQGQLVQVWAGAAGTQSPDKGRVFVAIVAPQGTDGSDNTVSQDVYDLPGSHGKMTITGGTVSAVAMQASDGSSWIFDPSGGAFTEVSPSPSDSASASVAGG